MAKVNYKIALENFSKIYFPTQKVDKNGFELLSTILDNVNTMIISYIQKKHNAFDKDNEQAFLLCARSAISENFPENLKANALAEAHKQVALLLNGFLEQRFKDTELPTKAVTKIDDTPKEVKPVPRVEVDQKTIETHLRPFSKGIESFTQRCQPGLKMEGKALRYLAIYVHAFCKMVAERTSKEAGKKEELQPADLKNVLSDCLGKNVLKLALGEGSRRLALYENGLIEFKPKKKSGLSSRNIMCIEPARPRPKTKTKRPKGKKLVKSFKRPKRSKKLKTKTPAVTKRSKKIKPSSWPQKRKRTKSLPGSKTIKKRKTKSPAATKRKRTLSATRGKKKKPQSPKVPKPTKKRKTKLLSLTKTPKTTGPPTKPKKRKTRQSPEGSKPSKKLKTKTPAVTRRTKKIKPSPKPKKRKPSKSITGSKKIKKRKTKHTPRPQTRKTSKSLPGSKTVKKSLIQTPPATKRTKITKPVAKPRKKETSKSLKVLKLSKKRKTKTPSATGKPKSTKAPSRQKKRKRSKDPDGSKPSKKLVTQTVPVSKKRIEIPPEKTVKPRKLALDVNSNVLNAFCREHIILEKEASNDVGQILGLVCDALIDNSVSKAGTSKQLTSEDTKAALLELFPLELTVHALAAASSAIFKYVNKI